MTEPSIRLQVGGKTDVGRLREVNQDSILLGPHLHAIADGMGGHRGGEVASAVAVEAVSRILEGTRHLTLDDLLRAVREANKAVFRQGMQDESLSGMGTTLVGLAVVEDASGPLIAIINVGDSRAYRFSHGELRQITDDHSLVGQLVRDGAITPEEAEVHPQRNIVTRALGMDEDIPVDDFEILPHSGDRYLLCSDGLTNEVPESEIASVLRRVGDPDDAADELVRLANESGGRDNVTVVVVDVIDDAGLARKASALVPDAEDFSHHPDTDTESYAEATGATSESARRRDAGQGPDGTEGVATEKLSWRERRAERRRNKPRAITLRSVLFVLVVAAVIGGGLFLVDAYATDTYHVTVDGDQVMIMKGRPGGFLWYEPSPVLATGIDADDVPDALIDNLEEGVTQSSLERALRYVQNLEDRIEAITPPVTTTAPRGTTTTTRPRSTTSTTRN